MERTLTSLRAEVQLRERCLSAARVPDISAYRSSTAAEDFVLPHLVIVIDEFRMLVDDAPEALRELLRIASIGRSLGIHLIMATQRPQGTLQRTSARTLRPASPFVCNPTWSRSISSIARALRPSVSTPLAGRSWPGGRRPPRSSRGHRWGRRAGGDSCAVIVHRTVDLLAARLPTRARASPYQLPAQAVELLAAMVRSLCTQQGKLIPEGPSPLRCRRTWKNPPPGVHPPVLRYPVPGRWNP